MDWEDAKSDLCINNTEDDARSRPGRAQFVSELVHICVCALVHVCVYAQPGLTPYRAHAHERY